MKKTTSYIILIILCTAVIFPSGKPCCNKKGISSKFNHINIDKKNDISSKFQHMQNNNLSNCKIQKESMQTICLETCKRKQWWKFWNKKNNCSCTNSKISKNDTK